MADILPFRRRTRSPKEWAPYRSSRRPWREVRLMVEAGLLIGLSVFGLSQLAGAQLTGPVATASVSTPASVRVIDGDTFDYAGERIRIADIDTPEVRGRCPEERAQAALATRRLRALLAAGPFELVRSGRDEDRYGRKLRVVVRDGRSVGDMLVAEGLARTWTGRREPWC
jgi:endonuclease YncB( thermonuclease family)